MRAPSALRASVAAGLPRGPIILSVGVAIVVWLATGVRPLEILGFAGYQALFVVAPGVLVLRALVGSGGSPVTKLAIGWPLGYVVELAAFNVTAAVGVRWLFFLYPVAAVALAIWAGGGRSSGATPRPASVPRSPAWATAVIIGAGIMLLGLGSFSTYPLPRSVPSVVLYTDSAYHVSLAAEARHHWPISDPNISGEHLRYHLFVHMEAAAVNEATGIELDVVLLRLQPVVIVLLIGLQLAWLAGRVARGSPWVAPGAVAIMRMANELDVDSKRPAPFGALLCNNLPLSPSFAFGLPFFIAAVGVLVYALSRVERPPRGTWIVVGALLVGAMGAKASTVPVVLLATGLFLVGRALLERTVDRRALHTFGLALGVFVVVYLVLFSGGGDVGGKIHAFAFLDQPLPPGASRGFLASLAEDLARIGALFAPWLGGLLLVGRVKGTERRAALWLGAAALGAVLPFVLNEQPAVAQYYFLLYGTPPAAVLSAWGIARAWPHMRTRLVPALAVAGTLVAALVVAVVLRGHRYEGTALPSRYFAAYAALIAVLVVIALVAAGRPRAALPWLLSLVVAVTLIDKPLDVLADWVDAEAARNPHYVGDQRDGPRGINTQLRVGLRWLRDHSDPDDVVATDVQTTTTALASSRYFYVAAYAERRTFLGGTDYTRAGIAQAAKGRGGTAFPARRELNAGAFRGDRRALTIIRRRYGVRFLVVDLSHSTLDRRLDRRLPRVYANPAVIIYRLR